MELASARPLGGLGYGAATDAISRLFGLSQKFLSEISDVLGGLWYNAAVMRYGGRYAHWLPLVD
jgi:hypothetical protein